MGRIRRVFDRTDVYTTITGAGADPDGQKAMRLRIHIARAHAGKTLIKRQAGEKMTGYDVQREIEKP